jgi:hypothetical protein
MPQWMWSRDLCSDHCAVKFREPGRETSHNSSLPAQTRNEYFQYAKNQYWHLAVTVQGRSAPEDKEKNKWDGPVEEAWGKVKRRLPSVAMGTVYSKQVPIWNRYQRMMFCYTVPNALTAVYPGGLQSEYRPRNLLSSLLVYSLNIGHGTYCPRSLSTVWISATAPFVLAPCLQS